MSWRRAPCAARRRSGLKRRVKRSNEHPVAIRRSPPDSSRRYNHATAVPLPFGARLGPYEVTAPIGVGGMGKVYRARDSRLNRDVALKVLPEAFILDPDSGRVATADATSFVSRTYGVSPDGKRFLMIKNSDAPTQPSIAERIVVVQTGSRS
jgi:serine/threonine protein kinase